MKTIDCIRAAPESSEQFTFRLIEDMRYAPLVQPTPRGGNHPLWVFGHLTVGEGVLLQTLLEQPNPVERWQAIFGPSSEPTTDPAAYPSFDEVLSAYRELRAKTKSLVDKLDDAALDRPVKPPLPELEAIFGTVGQALLMTALHQMSHAGQVADARRAAGRKPLMELSEPVAD